MPKLYQPGKVNAVELKEPLSEYELMTGLLLPLYAGRAAEEMFYGPQGITLSTASEVTFLSDNPGPPFGHPHLQVPLHVKAFSPCLVACASP